MADINPFASATGGEQTAEGYPRSRIAIFLSLALLGAFADLATKSWIFAQQDLRARQIWWVVRDYAGFQLSLNEGALFGMGQGWVWLFAALSLVAATAIPVWLFRYHAAVDLGLTVALGCVMAGVLGNLYDRLGLHGETWFLDPARIGQPAYAVRDWILLQWGPEYTWPNFNLADSFLVVGAAVILLKAITDKPDEADDKS